MHSLDRRFRSFGVLALAGMIFLSGCATRKWVRQEIGVIDAKVTEVANAGRENAERIDAVDRRAQQGITAAAAADTKATQAGTAAAAAQTAATNAQRQADTANQGVQQANTRITTLETRIAGINDNYVVSGQPVSVTFQSGSSTLSNDARAALDTIANSVSGQRAGYMLELQGYTDNVGSETFNDGLSQRRAESVLRYLVSKNVPLFRVSIVGLGEANPVAPNNNAAGRQQNRRVEVRTLRSATAPATN